MSILVTIRVAIKFTSVVSRSMTLNCFYKDRLQ